MAGQATTFLTQPAPTLLRRSERAAVESLIGDISQGRSASMVVRGEAGIGKTWLLDFADRWSRRAGVRVSRIAALESHMELAYAGVHELVAPLLSRVERLPQRQRKALDSALGRAAPSAPDRFLVALAVLTLLADAADEQPLLCLVDDAHWLDAESGQVLAFVARRLRAERLGMVFSVRDPPARAVPFEGLPELTLARLDARESRELIASMARAPLDIDFRDRIIAGSCGNPLALVEMMAGINTALSAGHGMPPDSLPISQRVEDRFLASFRALPPKTQAFLLLAATDEGLDAGLLLRAADPLGIGPADIAPAEVAGLIETGPVVKFRHPLVRSAVYTHATRADRQQAHRLLAGVIDAEHACDRRAWHRAQAAVAPDEEIACELERCADRARRRGGANGGAALLERAAALTPDPARRGTRTLAAAWAHFQAGNLGSAKRLAEQALQSVADPLHRAQALRLQGNLIYLGSDPSIAESYRLLHAAALALEPLDGRSAREAHLEAVLAAAALADTAALTEATRAGLAAPRPPANDWTVRDLYLEGICRVFCEGPAAGLPILKKALQVDTGDHGALAGIPESAAIQCWDDAALGKVLTTRIHFIRETGSLATLPWLLVMLGCFWHVPAGRLDEAEASIAEAESLSAAAGAASPVSDAEPFLLAWRGKKAECLASVDQVVHRHQASGRTAAAKTAQSVLAILYNGLGDYASALAAAVSVCDRDSEWGTWASWTLPELVEAATRCGERKLAELACDRLAERTLAAGTPWARGILARSRALLAEGPAAEAHYVAAIESLQQTTVATALARAHLLYGEWLRRKRKRRAALEHLAKAETMFTSFGASGFARRARGEAVAAGHDSRQRTIDSPLLTPAERRIADLAAQRLTDLEIAAALFISRNTVNYHLKNIFSKLGINSRSQLRRARLERK